MVGVDIGIQLLAAAAGSWHDYDTLMQRLELLEDEMKKRRVVRRHMNGYNIFTKQRSLERTENMRFGSIIEFLDFALDKNVFEKKRVHRKKALHGSDADGDGGELTLRSFTAETSKAYKNLPGKQKKIYKQIAAYISMPPYRKGDQSYRDLVDKIENLIGAGTEQNKKVTNK
jgi:hypothetical protein